MKNNAVGIYGDEATGPHPVCSPHRHSDRRWHQRRSTPSSSATADTHPGDNQRRALLLTGSIALPRKWLNG
jgi:hypothetical protein